MTCRGVIDVEDIASVFDKKWDSTFERCDCKGKSSTCQFGPVDVEDLASLCLFGQEQPELQKKQDVFTKFCPEERWMNCQDAYKCPLYTDENYVDRLINSSVDRILPPLPCYNYFERSKVECFRCGNDINSVYENDAEEDNDQWQEYLYVLFF